MVIALARDFQFILYGYMIKQKDKMVENVFITKL